MIRLSKITDDSWLVETPRSSDIQLLSKNQSNYTLIGNGSKITFQSMSEINEYFNEDIFNNIKDNTPVLTDHKYYIRGFLVNCENPIEMFAPTNGIPLYRQHEHSDVEYAAGYYAVSRGRWSYLLCPKLSTLQEYPYEGPFKTKQEAVNHIRGLRKNGQL